jgi:hypothetical protein
MAHPFFAQRAVLYSPHRLGIPTVLSQSREQRSGFGVATAIGGDFPDLPGWPSSGPYPGMLGPLPATCSAEHILEVPAKIFRHGSGRWLPRARQAGTPQRLIVGPLTEVPLERVADNQAGTLVDREVSEIEKSMQVPAQEKPVTELMVATFAPGPDVSRLEGGQGPALP